jgi:hypothetical protein
LILKRKNDAGNMLNIICIFVTLKNINMIKKKLFLILLMAPALCAAQIETDPGRAVQFNANPKYQSFVAGVGKAYLKNTYLSPMTHDGISANIGFNQTQYFRKGVTDLFVDIAADFTNIIHLQLEAGYFYHRLVSSREKLFLYAGVGGSLDVGLKINSLAGGYNAGATISNFNVLPSVMVKYRFSLFNKNFDLSQQIYMPVMGLGMYPRYSYALEYQPMMSGEAVNMASMFTSLHNYWGLGARTYIDWRIKNKKGIEKNLFYRFGYQYEGWRTSFDGRSYQLSRGIFFIGTIRKF